MVGMGRKRIGVFGWGVVAPKSPTVEAFESNLETGGSWLEPFAGFGPSNFLVGVPDFDFNDYRAWIDERFEPRKFSQLVKSSNSMVQYAIGAFIQSLGQNPELEKELPTLGSKAHVYVGTGLGDLATVHDSSKSYERAQRQWSRFWCRPDHCSELAQYRAAAESDRAALRDRVGAPQDPAGLDPEAAEYEDVLDLWLGFWIERSEGLKSYLAELQVIEAESVDGDIEAQKGHVIRHKVGARKRLNEKWGCPIEPWNSVDPRLLWNIPNIPGAQISMVGRITGACVGTLGACAGFGMALELANRAIQSGDAKVCVVGMTDPAPSPLSVAAFYRARVHSNDSAVSKPFTGMRGTHVSGGACVWIVGDAEYLTAKGMKPLGLEVLSVGLSADADHIITPSVTGPRDAMRAAMEDAGITGDDLATWDMHATATPGDWAELENTVAMVGDGPQFTARKGTFGHGMSVSGGWELTAQHMGVARGALFPIELDSAELHSQVREHRADLATNKPLALKSGHAGKINMGIGGINSCVICRRWDEGPPLD